MTDGGPKCGAKLRSREGTCTLPAGWGTEHKGHGRCRKHFGNSPNVAKAAERERVEAEAQRALAGITDFEAVTDPVLRLQLVAGRAERFMEVLGERVEELRSVRYSSEGGEQLRAEVALYERAMTSTGRLLVDLAKLGLDERMVRLSEAQGVVIVGIMLAAVRELGLGDEVEAALRPAIARQLRLTADRKRHGRIALESPR
jgi:hypothetical protein